jgi:hypothetical protein
MQIKIDIPYKTIYNMIQNDAPKSEFIKVIKNGIPILDDRGRMLSAKEMGKTLTLADCIKYGAEI